MTTSSFSVSRTSDAGQGAVDGGPRNPPAAKAVPRRLLVPGVGPAGVELAQVVRRLGGEAVLVEGEALTEALWTGCSSGATARSGR